MQQKYDFAFHGVSRLPVLVPASGSDIRDGCATFMRPTSSPQPDVHLVRDLDLKSSLTERLSLQDVEFVRGAAKLKDAYRDRDRAMAREAYAILEPALKEIGVITATGELETDDFYSATPGWFPIHYSRLMTSALADARLVWWWPTQNHSTLAVYCPTWKAALIVASYLDRFRMCPCGKIFVPRKSREVCCSKKHTNYYRLKRWRELQKQPRRRRSS